MGQQTYNDYMAGLADKIPELAQLAQSMYTTKLNTLQSLDATDYNRWGDERSNLYNLLNTYNDLESDYYGKWSDEYSNYLKAYEQDQALKAAEAAALAASYGGGGDYYDSGSYEYADNGGIVDDAVYQINMGAPMSAATRIAAQRAQDTGANVKDTLRKISQYRREGNLR